MKTRPLFVAVVLAQPSLLIGVSAYAADNACVEMCKEQNRRAVKLCNYPEKEPKELRECLERVRANFDACMQPCGK